MRQLKTSYLQVNKELAEKESFTINRTGTHVMEQTLMHSMKSSGSMKRSRGITESVLAQWQITEKHYHLHVINL